MTVRLATTLSRTLFSGILLLSLANISAAQSLNREIKNNSEQPKQESEMPSAEANSIALQENIASSTSPDTSVTNSLSNYDLTLTIETSTPDRSLPTTEVIDFQNQNLEPHNRLTFFEVDF
ncbi:MAG: hypothetical protein AAGE96_10010 [Cyanobacteria bacterium P01_G01_bin.19]